MSSNCTILRLDPLDAAAWADLRWEALQAHPLAFGSSVPDDPSELVNVAGSRLESHDDRVTFGAFVDSVLIGTVGILRGERPKERHKSLIVGMYVRVDNRRTGAGEKLLRAAIQHARMWDGVEQVQLVVNDVAPEAKRLYERVGFRSWGVAPRALCWQGRYTDATHMILDLRT